MEHKAHIAVHGDRPAIGNLIIVHENRGLDDHIRDVANRFAAIGMNTIAPDYLSPVGGSVADADDNIAAIKSISRDHVTETTAHWIKTLETLQPDTGTAILGFCWGGGVVNHCATQLSNLKGVIMFYGSAPADGLVEKIKAPLQLHYAENDERINAGREKYLSDLETNRIDFTHYIYTDAGHAFFNDSREDRYHGPSAELAFDRTKDFLMNVFDQK